MRRGNVLLKTRVRDAEDSLAQLVHDEDQIVAAAADALRRAARPLDARRRPRVRARASRRQGLVRVRGRVVGAGRAAPDGRAAGQRAGSSRCRRWSSPIACARLPLFRFTSVDELFRIAGTGRQVRHEPGRVIYEAGRAATDLEFLLDGTVTRDRRRDDAAGDVSRAGRARLRRGVRRGAAEGDGEGGRDRDLPLAAERAVPRAAVGEHRAGAGHLPAAARRARRRRLAPRHQRRGRMPPSAARLRDGLQPIEKVLVLEEMPVFSRATSEQLAALAGIAREVKIAEGERAVPRGRRAGHPHRARGRAVARADGRRRADARRRRRLPSASTRRSAGSSRPAGAAT